MESDHLKKLKNNIEDIFLGKKEPSLNIYSKDITEVISILEESKLGEKVGHVKFTFMEEVDLIDLDEIGSARLNVIQQKWKKIVDQGYKVTFLVQKKKVVSEIVNMKKTSDGSTRYNAGDVSQEDLLKGRRKTLLNKIQDKFTEKISVEIAGVSTSTFLIGTVSQSSIPLHIEDVAFGSLNLHHSGADKVWMIVPPSDGILKSKFYQTIIDNISVFKVIILARQMFPEEYEKCPHFMTNHKNIWMTKEIMEEMNIRVSTVTQKQGTNILLVSIC